MISKNSFKNIILFIFTAFLGLAAIVIPPLLLPVKHYEAPLFPLIRTGIEAFSFLSMVLLILCGIIAGMLSPAHKYLWGFASVSLFPLISIAEMIVDPSSHKLWPIEFTLTYGFFFLFTLLGALLGKFAIEIRDRNLSRSGASRP